MNPTWPQTLAGAIITAAAVLAALGYLGRKAKQMWITSRRTSRKAALFFDQVLGDRSAEPPVPSLIEKVDGIARDVASLKLDAAEQRRDLDEVMAVHAELGFTRSTSSARQNRRKPRT